MELSEATLEIFSNLEHRWLSHCDARKIRILSIDGGDQSGAVAGSLLVYLEDQIRAKSGDINARIADFFDLVAGTGIGALYAAMINADDGNGRPMFSASEAVDFVMRNKDTMFKRRKLLLFRLWRKSSCGSRRKVLKEAFTRGDGKVLSLKDTCKPLLVPCFDLQTYAPLVFSRADAYSDSQSFDFELWKVGLATLATPDLFKPFLVTSVDGKNSCLAMDGGLVMNNPTAAAVTHVLHNKSDFPSVRGIQDLSILSIGNGVLCRQSRRRRPLRRNGQCSTSAVVEIAKEGVSETVDQMIADAFFWNRADYVRIQSSGCCSSTADDVLKERGLVSLPFCQKRLAAETNGRMIENFVQRLVATGRTSLPPSPIKTR